MDKKKELKQLYKETKKDMGIFIVRTKNSNKCYIEATQDLKGKINGTLARLGGGMHPNRELLEAWKELGAENFIIEVLEKLEYDKDESKTDYTEELAILQMIWEEKLANEKMEFYKK